jgi:galactonate dehydratase
METVTVTVIEVTDHTDWVHVTVRADGLVGFGEATLEGCESHVVAEIATLEAELLGRDVEPGDPAIVPDPDARGGLASAAARSAVDQALWDLEGRRASVPVAALLGGEPGAVDLYANINRSLRSDRTADAFAAVARSACSEGFTAVKIAPFDGVRPELADSVAGGRAIDQGIERATAVRDAIGRDRNLMIDCHGRRHVRVELRRVRLRGVWLRAGGHRQRCAVQR